MVNDILNSSENTSENKYEFEEIFELDKLQHIQDLFSDATGVASIITKPDGAPITLPSNFCSLCSNIIRKTKKGQANCYKSDALLGKFNPSGPLILPCLSGGLWDAGASITVGGKHIANWLIGQVRNDELDEQQMLKYADEIGADKEEFLKALHEVPIMSIDQFTKVTKMLFAFANEISDKAYNNLLLKKEIEEHKKAEIEILKQKNLLNTIIESSSEAIFAKDKEGKYQSINIAGSIMLGFEADEIIGKTDKELLPALTADEFRKTDEFVLYSDQISVREETGIINGEKATFLAHKSPWRDIEGNIIGIIGISNNITEQKKIEEALNIEQQFTKKIINSLPGIFYLYTYPQLRLVMWNKNHETLLGFEAGEMKDRYLMDWHVPEAITAVQEAVDLVMDKGINVLESPLLHKDGYYIPFLMTGMKFEMHNQLYLMGIGIDITERKKIEEALIQSENNYRNFLDESPLGIRIITSEGKTQYVNNAFLTICGLKSYDEFQQTPLSQQYTENEKAQHEIRKAKRKKGEAIPIDYEIEIRRKDGQLRQLLVMRKEIFWNQAKQFQVIYQDITERKKAEKALIESNELISLFISHSPIYTFIKDVSPTESSVIKASDNFFDMIGIKGADMTGKNMYELFPKEFAEKITADDWQVVSKGELIKLDEDFNGKYYTTIKFPIKIGDKNLLAGYTIDITDQKIAEKEVAKAKILLEQTFEQSPIPMVLVSMPDAVIRIANPACIAFLGMKDEPTPVGISLMELKPSWQDFDLDGKLAKTEELPLYRSLMGQKTDGEERYLVLKDGSVHYQLAYGCPIFDDKGNLLAGYLIMLDITDRKKVEMLIHEKNVEYLQINEELTQTNDELIRAKDRAEESERLKTAFLQNMSHEIRTPMNAIIGFSGMLNRPKLSDEKRKNYVSIITNSSKQLLSIVTDILTISSIETRQEKLDIQKVNINSLVVDLLAIFKTQAYNQNVSIYSRQELNDLQSEIYTDRTKITQILTNLITNALKFTHEGSVKFGYGLVETRGRASLQFYVKDTGIGIGKEHHEKIFERFRQADLSINKTYGGTGLGLSISKGFVELLGGKIWVDSEPQKGSTFYFTIPYKPVHELESIVSISKQNKNKLTILVAEDEEFNFLLIEEFLLNLDFTLIHSKDGEETVEICKSNPDIALVLMDIKMPLMDGHTAALKIKEFRPQLPIVAQTAYALAHEIEKYQDNAFDDYIIKPIDENELKEKIKKCLGKV